MRERISWKYALGLELTNPGFHYSVLSEFRQRPVAGSAERRLLDKLLKQCATRGLLKGKKKQRTDSTHVLAAIRTLTLLELVGETMRRPLDDIARVAPEWLQERMQPEGIKRYGRRFDSYRLPKGKEKRLKLATTIGRDGYYLLTAVLEESAPAEVRALPMIDILRRSWVQQFYWCEGEVHWRTKKKWGQPPAGKMIASTEDLEAKYCVKRSTEWTGYKVHLTETCAKDHPRLITQVETTVATKHDSNATQTIQDDLAAREPLPETHLVDEGYTEADLLVDSQKRGVTCWVLFPAVRAGRTEPKTLSTIRSSTLTGSAEWPPVPAARQAPVAQTERHGVARPILPLLSALRTVCLVLCAHVALAPRPVAERLPFILRSNMKRCRERGSDRRPTSSRCSTASGLASREPFPRGVERWGCGAPGISVLRERACSM